MPTVAIDLITYTNNNTDSSVNKSCADDSSDFENVLNEINKTYSEQDSQKNAPLNAQTEPKKIDDKITENHTEKAPKNEGEKQNEKITDKNDSVKDSKENSSADKIKEKAEKDEKSKKDKKAENVEKAEKSDNNEKNKISDENSQEEKIEDLSKINNGEITQKIETKSDNIEEPVQKDIKVSTNDTEFPKDIADKNTANPPVENIIEKLPVDSNIKVSNETLTNTAQNADKTNNVQNQQPQNEQIEAVQKNLSIDVTNSTKNIDELLKTQQVQVQTQTEQVLTNLKINSQDIVPEAAQIQTETSPVQAQTETEPKQVTSEETPVIKANVNIIVNDTNINSSLTDINKVNSKLGIGNREQINSNVTSPTQEMLDKTNAQITNIETSNSSSSNANSNPDNFLSKQNIQDQAVKLELENNSNNISQNNMQDIDLTNTADTTGQTSTDKTFENTQTITQTVQQPTNNSQTLTTQAPQASKELSRSDILSQINNQLDMKKLQEEGTTKVNIVLRPENLGKINLEFVSSKEGLTAKMTTDNAQVKELLTKSLDSLKDSLSSQGVNVNSVTVKVEETQKQSNDMFSFDSSQSQEGGQEFSNNAQKQNQREFSSDDSGKRIIAEGEERISAEIDIENEEVSVSPYSTNVDYKV